MTKEQKIFKALQDIFIGAKIEGKAVVFSNITRLNNMKKHWQTVNTQTEICLVFRENRLIRNMSL